MCAEIVVSTFAVRCFRDIPGVEADDCYTATEGAAYHLALLVCLFLHLGLCVYLDSLSRLFESR
jgi:hypothetical protein